MNGTRTALKLLLVCIGLAVALPGAGRAGEILGMQAPIPSEFVYRVTADNHVILPAPVVLRFSRIEQGLVCSKYDEVGVNMGYDGYFPPLSGPAPGREQEPNSIIYTSPVSNGGGLCSFNFNDTLVTIPLPVDDARKRDWMKRACLDAPLYVSPTALAGTFSRRKTYSFDGSVPFRVFYRKKSGEYEWKEMPSPPGNLKCDTWAPFFCRFPAKVVCEAIPNRPPVFEKGMLSHYSVGQFGQGISVTLWAYDDVDVRSAYAVASVGDTVLGTIPMKRHVVDSGSTAAGEKRSGWGAMYTIPQNTSTAPRTISFTFKVTDVEGAETSVGIENAQKVQQAGVTDTTPPKILAFTVAPQAFPAGGGGVTVSVKASDNIGVGAVELTLIHPNGQLAPMQMPLVGGTYADGEWRTGWNMWANQGTSQLVYQVKATVMDAARNTVSSQVLPITVAGKPPIAIQQQPSGVSGPAGPTGIPRQGVPVPAR